MYPNYYGAGAMPDALSQYRNGYSQPQQAASPQPSIIWVQGESGAKSYLVAAGQSVLLMDSEANTFYIKSSDASGMPLPLRIFNYTEISAKQPTGPIIGEADKLATKEEIKALEAQINELRAMIKEA